METENVFASTNCELSLRQKNTKIVENSPKCQQVINRLRDIEKFLEDFDDLTSCRNFVFGKSIPNMVYLSLNNVITSLELTIGSVIVCCESACIADANTLLRKYRDDLFFYLYVTVYNNLEANSEKAKSMEKQIQKWLNNELTNFPISDVLKNIARDPQLINTVKRYRLQDSFRNIGDYLNNYVHGNGQAYYNCNVDFYRENELVVKLKKLEENARYITVVFLLLLILCSPAMVMAEDYIAYLEIGETPPEDSQYWVAPFIENFLKENISLIDSNCINYLRENTTMQI